MKITRQQLRKLINKEKKRINESCGGGCSGDDESANVLQPIYAPIEDSEMMNVADDAPCPYSTAEGLKASGMGPQEVLQWVNTMLSSYNSEGEFSFTGDVGELGGDEAFGIGYEAGSGGL